jgi:hypothetical protein
LSTDVSEVRASTINALMMDAARTSETSVDSNTSQKKNLNFVLAAVRT